MSKQLHIRIQDPQLWKDFKEFILNKYGIKHTVMALEVEKAVYCHLAREGWMNYTIDEVTSKEGDSPGTYTHTKKLKPKEIMFLDSFYREFFLEDKISNSRLSEYIRATVQVKDWRAVQNWRHLLENLGWIESPGPRSNNWFIQLTPEKYDETLGVVV